MRYGWVHVGVMWVRGSGGGVGEAGEEAGETVIKETNAGTIAVLLLSRGIKVGRKEDIIGFGSR